MEIKCVASNVERFDKLPDGWMFLEGAWTAPKGWKWACNRQSRFSPYYKQGLVKVDV